MIRASAPWLLLVLLGAVEASADCIHCHDGLAVDGAALPQNEREALGLTDAAGCVLCHGGDPGADDEQGAHRDAPASLAREGGPRRFYADPGDPSAAEHTCGQCHAGYAARWVKSIMSTEAGRIERGLCADAWRLRHAHNPVPEVFGRYGISDEDGPEPAVGTPRYRALMLARVIAEPALYPRSLRAVPAHRAGDESESCAACHVEDRAVPRPGCSGCHRAHTADGPLHAAPADDIQASVAAGIPIERCFACHFDPRTTARNDTGDAVVHYGSHGVDGTGSGLWCQDCHTSIEMHGDGNIPTSADAQSEIRCEDCHGTLDKLPWELPLAAAEGTAGAADLRHAPPRGVVDANGAPVDVPKQPGQAAYLLTSRGNVLDNVRLTGDGAQLHSVSGHVHEVRLLARLAEQGNWSTQRAQEIKSNPELHASLGCMDCHADWLPTCDGCHAKPSNEGTELGAEREHSLR